MAESALRELLAAFHVKVEDEELDKGAKKVEGFIGKLQAVAPVLAEAFGIHVLKEFVEQQIEAGAQLKVTADRVGTTTDELQAMQLAAREAGLSSDSLADGLRFLNRNIAEANGGGKEQAALFGKLGIKLKEANGEVRPAGDVMGDLADAIAEIPDAAEKTNVAMHLLGRGGAELIPLLNRGHEAFEEARKDVAELGGGLGHDFVEQAHKAEEANVRLEFASKGLKSALAGVLIPAFASGVEWLTKVVAGAIELTKKTKVLESGAIVLSVVLGVKLLGSLKSVLGVFGLLKPTVGETVGALLKFAWPAVLVAGLFLVFDELYTLMRGGKTVIGDTLDKLFGLGTGAQLGLFMNAVVKDGIRFFKDLGLIIVESVLVAVNATADAVLALAGALSDIAHGRWDQIGKNFTEGFKDIPGMVAKIRGAGGDLVDGPRSELDTETGLLRRGADPQKLLGLRQSFDMNTIAGMAGLPGGRALVSAAREPTSFARGGGSSGAAPVVQQKNEFNVTVHTSSNNPEGVGKAAGMGVASSQEKATNNALQAVRSQ